MFLGLPKKHFDPFVCAEICEQATTESYSKTGKIIANKIGKRTSNNININRATSRNIVLAFNPEYNEINELKRVEKLFIRLDEKFISSQFNEGKNFMTKASVIFEDYEKEYSYKKKETLWVTVQNELKNFQSLISLSLPLILKYSLQWTIFILNTH